MPGANFMPNEINFQIQLFGSLLVWFRGRTHKNGLKLTWAEFDRFVDEFAQKHESR